MSGSERAWLLHQRGRNEEALDAARQALSQDPDDVSSRAVLALSLAELGRKDEARRAAEEVVEQEPDVGLSHYVLAHVALEGGRRKDALASVRVAIQIEPENPDYHAFEAQLFTSARRWKQALSAADKALELDPEHVSAKNLRSMVLASMGRADEAHEEADDVLRLAPDDSVGHANRGFAYLHQRDVPKALEHFSEALRLDPENDYARAGLVEALKARNPLYRAILAWYLFSSRFAEGRQVMLFIGVIVVFRVLRKALGAVSPLAGLAVVAVYMAFVYFTWVGDLLFNLMLWLDRKTRHVLDDEQRVSAWLLGGCYALGVGLFGLVAATAGPLPALLPLGMSIALGVPVAGIFTAGRGWPRVVASTITVAIGLGLVAGALVAGFGESLGLGLDAETKIGRAASIQLGCLAAAGLNTWVSAALSTRGSKG